VAEVAVEVVGGVAREKRERLQVETLLLYTQGTSYIGERNLITYRRESRGARGLRHRRMARGAHHEVNERLRAVASCGQISVY
jgi:hypothetical protein